MEDFRPAGGQRGAQRAGKVWSLGRLDLGGYSGGAEGVFGNLEPRGASRMNHMKDTIAGTVQNLHEVGGQIVHVAKRGR